jgi:hypothetical protein
MLWFETISRIIKELSVMSRVLAKIYPIEINRVRLFRGAKASEKKGSSVEFVGKAR